MPRILIVEDDESTRHLLKGILTDVGVLDFAVDGQTAIDHYTDAKRSGEPYTHIVLDLMMPNIDGQPFLKHVRGLEEGGVDFTSVIILSARDDAVAVLDTLREGAELYLTKPVDSSRLLSAISGH